MRFSQVQRITALLTTTSDDVVIATVDMAKTIVRMLGYEGDASASNWGTRVKLLDSTHLRFERNAAGANINVNVVVLEIH